MRLTSGSLPCGVHPFITQPFHGYYVLPLRVLFNQTKKYSFFSFLWVSSEMERFYFYFFRHVFRTRINGLRDFIVHASQLVKAWTDHTVAVAIPHTQMFNFRCGRDWPEWARMLFNFQFSFFFLAMPTAEYLAFSRFYRSRAAHRHSRNVCFIYPTKKQLLFL